MPSPRSQSVTPNPEASAAPAPDQDMAKANIINSENWRDVTEAYVAKARHDGSDLSVLLVDIDAVKTTNDELGHHTGSQLIDLVDELNGFIVESVRTSRNPDYPDRELDLVTSKSPRLVELDRIIPGIDLSEPVAERIGGDEFGITLPNTDRDGANVVAKRLKAAFAERLGLPENAPLVAIGVDISIGVATLEPGMTASDLLRSADLTMYAKKLRQLRPLSAGEESEFFLAVEHLENAGVRPRDVGKYVQLLSASAINHAIENRRQEDQGQLALLTPDSSGTEKPK